MSTDEPNENGAAAEEHHRYQAVMVAFDIENVTVITNEINVVEAAAHISEALPVGSFTLKIPVCQRFPYGRISFCKISNWCVADDNHTS